MRIPLFLLILALVTLFWGLPTFLELREAQIGWTLWAPTPEAMAWTYAQQALQFLIIVAGLLFLRQVWKQFWRALAD